MQVTAQEMTMLIKRALLIAAAATLLTAPALAAGNDASSSRRARRCTDMEATVSLGPRIGRIISGYTGKPADLARSKPRRQPDTGLLAQLIRGSNLAKRNHDDSSSRLRSLCGPVVAQSDAHCFSFAGQASPGRFLFVGAALGLQALGAELRRLSANALGPSPANFPRQYRRCARRRAAQHSLHKRLQIVLEGR